MALIVAPLGAQAETWNIYGWQNHSWEFVDNNGSDSDRIQSNAGNIGFAASMDAGNDISVNVQCEQFTYYNHFGGGTGWCNRNSKIGLSHPQMGEIMFATWLLPYNEGVAQWVDPFYDAGADSHTSIMGSVGAHTIFYNTGDFDIQASGSGPLHGSDAAGVDTDNEEVVSSSASGEFNYAVAGYDTGFNRRQENIIQYWSPNWNGFVFRFAWTVGNRDESVTLNGHEADPVIRSSSLAYTNGPFWGAVTWQDHEDWTAVSVGNHKASDSGHVMESSDAESIRIAGRYIMDMGDGVSVQISAMWEDLEYEFNNVTSIDEAMAAFGYGGFADSGNLMITDNEVKAQKTVRLIYDLFDDPDQDGFQIDAAVAGLTSPPAYTAPTGAVEDDPLTETDETVEGTGGNLDTSVLDDTTDGNALETAVMALDAARTPAANADAAALAAAANAELQYDMLVDAATANARAMKAGNVKIERDAWMVSGKIKFGGPLDFRFSYMDADDLEVSCGGCSGDWNETAADAWNVGLFYTMPGGTELRLTYSEVDNDDNGTYGQGISGTGLGTPGSEIEMFAVGIVHWFD